LFLVVAAFAAFLAPSALSAAELVLNGDFATGDFTDWTQFTTANGTLGSSPNPQVVLFNVTGAGSQDAAKFNVGEVSFTSAQEGGGISHDITTAAGILDFSAAIASFKIAENASAGVYSVLLDGVVKATDDLGPINAGQTLRGMLDFSTSVAAGTHHVEILITRPFQATAGAVLSEPCSDFRPR
jgi:hypothetical protein